jgi:hypothetical protein
MINPILQKRKQRLREMKKISEDHKQWSHREEGQEEDQEAVVYQIMLSTLIFNNLQRFYNY